MMPSCLVPRVAAVLALLLAVPPATTSALTLEETRCLCADGVRNTGDFVSCMAHLTRRLEAAGELSPAERVEIIRASAQASLDEIAALPAACASAASDRRWGIGLQVHQEKVAPRGSVQAEALLWNLTSDDVGAGSGSGFGSDCHLRVHLQDAAGLIVHRSDVFCPSVEAEFMIPGGTVTRVPVTITAVHREADNGMPDGSPLPAGEYRASIEPDLRVPNRTPLWDGLEPTASFRIVVE